MKRCLNKMIDWVRSLMLVKHVLWAADMENSSWINCHYQIGGKE